MGVSLKLVDDVVMHYYLVDGFSSVNIGRDSVTR